MTTTIDHNGIRIALDQILVPDNVRARQRACRQPPTQSRRPNDAAPDPGSVGPPDPSISVSNPVPHPWGL